MSVHKATLHSALFYLMSCLFPTLLWIIIAIKTDILKKLFLLLPDFVHLLKYLKKCYLACPHDGQWVKMKIAKREKLIWKEKRFFMRRFGLYSIKFKSNSDSIETK